MAVIPLGYPMRDRDGPGKRALEYVVKNIWQRGTGEIDKAGSDPG